MEQRYHSTAQTQHTAHVSEEWHVVSVCAVTRGLQPCVSEGSSAFNELWSA